MPKISTGDMLRNAVASGSSLGHLVKETVARGALVSDDVIVALVRERLAAADAADGYVLDGFPRTVAQAEALDGLLNGAPLAVVEIRVPDDELVRRVRGRRICERAGRRCRRSTATRRWRRRARPAAGGWCSGPTTASRSCAIG